MYLLVGQRMWDGAIPYVDIWDRKPIGLFLIYAASAELPIDAIVAYHLVALAAAVVTAGCIAMLVRTFAGPKAALAAAILYLVWLSLIGGRGGQSPVFYDLPMVLAAWLTWQTLAGRRRGGGRGDAAGRRRAPDQAYRGVRRRVLRSHAGGRVMAAPPQSRTRRSRRRGLRGRRLAPDP